MARPAPTTCGEQQATNELQQRLEGPHSVLRKPLKLTATLRRRALKNKAAVTSRIGGAPSPSRL